MKLDCHRCGAAIDAVSLNLIYYCSCGQPHVLMWSSIGGMVEDE